MAQTSRPTYSKKMKYNAVVLYKSVGNMASVSRSLGIPVETIANWKNQDWWLELEEELKNESRAKISKSLQKTIDKAFEELDDRLENGDWFFDPKQGKLIRKPINAQIVNNVLRDSLHSTVQLEKLKQTEKRLEKQEEVDARLLKLAEEFKRFSQAKLINIEELDAIHDKREEGLQEGESPLQIETGTNQETSSEERSPETTDGGGVGEEGGREAGGSQDSFGFWGVESEIEPTSQDNFSEQFIPEDSLGKDEISGSELKPT